MRRLLCWLGFHEIEWHTCDPYIHYSKDRRTATWANHREICKHCKKDINQ